ERPRPSRAGLPGGGGGCSPPTAAACGVSSRRRATSSSTRLACRRTCSSARRRSPSVGRGAARAAPPPRVVFERPPTPHLPDVLAFASSSGRTHPAFLSSSLVAWSSPLPRTFLPSTAVNFVGITLSVFLSKTNFAQPVLVSSFLVFPAGPYVMVIVYGGVPFVAWATTVASSRIASRPSWGVFVSPAPK